MAEGDGLLNRCTALKPYRGFESLRLRHFRGQDRKRQLTPNRVFTSGIGDFLALDLCDSLRPVLTPLRLKSVRVFVYYPKGGAEL